ncbi:hypothetical protein ColTof4_02082 [Colletotrichum tofieldiae]|nr:hypothetical protein ColTof3_09632 [Colletotrichum tofieldiae]GKT69660.1 hypothetical protein ColTof4_02082 [Colletotrichum tofieldiae]GKT92520.1 hypothetical protein Ct61P_10370 [Colletotrichum tofieldiae]
MLQPRGQQLEQREVDGRSTVHRTLALLLLHLEVGLETNGGVLDSFSVKVLSGDGQDDVLQVAVSHSKELAQPRDLVITLGNLRRRLRVELVNGGFEFFDALLAGLQLLLQNHDGLPQGLGRDLLREIHGLGHDGGGRSGSLGLEGRHGRGRWLDAGRLGSLSCGTSSLLGDLELLFQVGNTVLQVLGLGCRKAETLKKMLLRLLAILDGVAQLTLPAGLEVLEVVLVLALQFLDGLGLAGLSLLHHHLRLGLGSLNIHVGLVELGSELDDLFLEFLADNVDMVVGFVNLALHGDACSLDLVDARFSGFLEFALVAHSRLVELVILSLHLAEQALETLALADSTHSLALTVLQSLNLGLKTLTRTGLGLELSVQDLLTCEEGLLALGAASILLGDVASSLSHVFLEGDKLRAPAFPDALVLLELGSKGIEELLQLLVLVEGLVEIDLLPACSLNGALCLGPPAAGFLVGATQIILHRVGLVSELGLGLHSVRVRGLHKRHAHGLLGSGLFKGLKLVVSLLDLLSETVLLFGSNAEKPLDLGESVFGGTATIKLCLSSLLLVPKLFLEITDAVVENASVHDFDLDASLGGLQLPLQLCREIFSSTTIGDLLLGLGSLDIKAFFEIDELGLELTQLVVDGLVVIAISSGLLGWGRHALLDSFLDNVAQILATEVKAHRSAELLPHLLQSLENSSAGGVFGGGRGGNWSHRWSATLLHSKSVEDGCADLFHASVAAWAQGTTGHRFFVLIISITVLDVCRNTATDGR